MTKYKSRLEINHDEGLHNFSGQLNSCNTCYNPVLCVIPYVTEVIRTYAKNHKNRTAQNNNQLIRDLFNQPEIGRRPNRMWPEDLIR
jgi:hypothetical protein